MNLVEATLDGDHLQFGGFRIPLDRGRRPVDGNGRPVILGIRPESFEDSAFSEHGLPQIEATVAVVEELGSDAHVIFQVDAPRVEAEELRAAVEEEEGLLADERTSLFNARVDPRTSARVGERIQLSVDPRAFYFFDPATGDSLARPTRNAERQQTRA
jgi:multiple sugar transport system ATP-binding protein